MAGGCGAADARIACEDNRTFLSRFVDGAVKLIVTSPPYNIGKSYERKIALDEYLRNQAPVIAECVRVLDETGSLCWQVGHHVNAGEVVPLDIALYPLFKSHGLLLRNRIVWHFEHGLHCSRRLSGRHETILWFTKSNAYAFHLDDIRVPPKYPNKRHFKGPKLGQLSCHPLGKNPGDVWIFPNVKNNHVEKTNHPCQFPVELAERLILALTSPGDLVLDPYMGVGTTVVAAIKRNRRGAGCDVVPEYVETARARLLQLEQGVLKTRPMGRPVYDPWRPGERLPRHAAPSLLTCRRGGTAADGRSVEARRPPPVDQE